MVEGYNMKARIFFICLVILTASSCVAQAKDGNFVGSTKGGSIGVKTIDYNGKPLYCVDETHGLSCDWVRYHHENGF